MNPWEWLNRYVSVVLDGKLADCAEDEATMRRTLVTAWVGVSIVTPIWGVTYIIYGEVLAGSIPVLYGIFSFVTIEVYRRIGGFEWIRIVELMQHLWLPFLLMWILGGFGPSSAVLIWAFLAPLSSLWARRSKEAYVITGSFIALTAFSALIDSSLAGENNLPPWLVTGFYAGNFIVMTVVVFALITYFVSQQEQAVMVLRRNRELEEAYLQQEVSLRQREKLATIGKLSAGLAHELNNPAAAVQQATQGLSTMLIGEDNVQAEIYALDLTDAEAAEVADLAARIGERVDHPAFLDPLERSDRESEVQDVLEDAGVEDGWEMAPSLVGLGLETVDVERLTSVIDPTRLRAAVGLLSDQFQRQSLLGSLDESTRRIIGMVGALKTYTHLDQAPQQSYDVHEGLDSTLVMFRNRLKTGIEIHQDYEPSLPTIEAHGSELNQVWTNIVDNAIDAMDGHGVISLTTRRNGDHVVVKLADDGPGVPADIVDTIFDPFVTSKPPGEGTGLGLNISHSIVTQKHGGEISVESEPGRTVFTVRLPIGSSSTSAAMPTSSSKRTI